MSQSFRLGLFILATLAMLAACVFLVGSQESKFGSNYIIRSEFPNVAGLSAGADVRVGGIREGTVRSIQLPKSPNGKITVSMNLAKATQAIVKQDSVASIQSEGLLGDKYVEISFGSEDGARLKGGETIEGQPPFDISDLLGKANQILDTTQSSMENIQGATENIGLITSKINQGQGTIGKLVNDTTLYKQASAGITALHEDANALQHNFLLRGFFKRQGYSDPAEIQRHEIPELPKEQASKTFDFDPKTLFDKPDTAKLKNEKRLAPVGEFLQDEKWGSVVITVSSGSKGDSDQERVLSEARAYVVRKYLVDNYHFDDTRVKTLGLGKTETDAEGTVRILIYSGAPTQPTAAALPGAAGRRDAAAPGPASASSASASPSGTTPAGAGQSAATPRKPSE